MKLLRTLKAPTIGEKADKILLYLGKCYSKPGIQFQLVRDQPNSPFLKLVGVAWAEDETELNFLLTDFLCSELGYLEKRGGIQFFRITPRGWAYLHALNQGNVESINGFIAMWFNETVDAAHAAIETGVSSAGYKPLRIDKHQHNNRIDDEILAGIRRSRFLVADFTGQRGGVYFEAGFALGLGRPVIWLCRKDDLPKVHFDNRQYNFVLWEDSNLPELSKALQNRIEATIGRGPLVASA